MSDKNVYAVIGSNYGDEGKGGITAYLTRKHKKEFPIVVRHNGGAQAGHTVDDGIRRIVFSHVSSGSMDDVPTFLARHFIVAPDILLLELEDLESSFNLKPKVLIDPECRVSTVLDIAWNEAIETNRGALRHGSCGMGIFATVERHRTVPLTMDMLSTYTKDNLAKKIKEIQIYYKAKAFELDIVMPNWAFNDDTVEKMVDLFGRCNDVVVVCQAKDVYKMYPTIIFEGAQGLLLSEDNVDDMPHLTPSKTGLTNVIEELSIMEGTPTVTVVYVTRTYLTRHGAGPMENETNDKALTSLIDDTNEPNEYQGKLRYGYIDVEKLIERCENDFEAILNTGARARRQYAVTCNDQLAALKGLKATYRTYSTNSFEVKEF